MNSSFQQMTPLQTPSCLIGVVMSNQSPVSEFQSLRNHNMMKSGPHENIPGAQSPGVSFCSVQMKLGDIR